MEENNTQNENNNSIQAEHRVCMKKCIAMVLAAFLGGFLAVYFVTDQIMERSFKKHYHPPMPPERFERNIYKDMDRMYKNDMKAFDEAFKKFDKNFDKHMGKLPKFKHNELDMPFFITEPVNVRTEFDDNKFEVIVPLKPFNNDEKKINYNVSGRKLSVFGSSEVKDKDFSQNIQFSQDFILPENADIANISKEKDDNELIISVPVKQ